MKTKRKVFLGILAVLVVAYGISIIPNVRHRAELNQALKALQDLPRERLDSAIRSFIGTQKAQGRSAPETVSLRELVASGSLDAKEAAPFGGKDVMFAVSIDETRPEQVIARVPLSSGLVVVELADGSIQEVAR